jgi:hypothetical protein
MMGRKKMAPKEHREHKVDRIRSAWDRLGPPGTAWDRLGPDKIFLST